MRASTRRGGAGVALGLIAFAFVVGVTVVGLVNTFVNGVGNPADSVPASALPSRATALASPVASATTDPGVVLVGAGDIANCDLPNDHLTADLLETIPGIVFTLGDNAYPDGSARAFRDCYGPTWGRPSIKARTRPTVGDHDYDTPGAAGYFEYFGAAAGEPGKGYYAYNAGTWRVYVLNSACAKIGGCYKGSAQDVWLRKDLAENPRRCVLAMWHAPLFSSGPHGHSGAMRDLGQVLFDAGAELVLSGNDHLYERFAPQTIAGVADPDEGIVQIVAGTGGAETSSFGKTTLPNSLVRASGVAGVVRLELRPDSYSFEFVSVAGPQFEDAGTADCH